MTTVATDTSNLKAVDVKVRVFVPDLVKVMLNLLQAIRGSVCVGAKGQHDRLCIEQCSLSNKN